MSLFFIFSILLIYLFIQFILKRMVKKYGKISYDGFSAAGFHMILKKIYFIPLKMPGKKILDTRMLMMFLFQSFE